MQKLMTDSINRREWLAGVAATCTALGTNSHGVVQASEKVPLKPVAAILTRYEKGLHADVLIGKLLEGWRQDGGPGPALRLASMYVDQFAENDLAREMSKKHRVPITDSIEQALTLGTDRIAVDGVISVGEHGSYPSSDIGQILYPRRRFFEEITNAFEKYGRVVPVFNDKHLGPAWVDAKWMYDRAKQLEVPFMAGTSLAVTFRDPPIQVPMNCEVELAVGVGYSHLDIYGFHAIECLQCLVERRRAAESGVRWVQCLTGKDIWKPLDDGLISQEAFEAAFALVKSQPDQLRNRDDSALFLFQYIDGPLAAIFMLPVIAHGISVALKLKGDPKLLATRFEERSEPRHPHFAYLLKGIERMVHTGRPSYPIERTYLASGILDRALTSKSQQQQKLRTPELAIRYQPVDYPHAPLPELASEPS